MRGFEILSLSDYVHDRPASWHWHFVAEAVLHRLLSGRFLFGPELLP